MSSVTSLSTGETDPEEPELGVLMTGGRDSTSSPLASAEWFGSETCYVPPLPEPRSGHVTFVTANKTIATCGGRTEATKLPLGVHLPVQPVPASRQCLVLQPGEGGEWSQGVMGDLVLGEQRPPSCPTTGGGTCIFPYILGMYPAASRWPLTLPPQGE